ncbi:MAG: tetratricopeptide repeat protein [Deltaproteobacteria bacterium]|nr:tetratricopeptide repeat protein [Deltaproteobacteria bacterium]
MPLSDKDSVIGFPVSKKATLCAAVLSALITFIVYIPALWNGFVGWDDPAYVYENAAIQSINSAFFNYIFTTPVNGNWHPLTILSYAVDYAIWGLDPWGYHFVNILFHAVNTALVFILTFELARAGGRRMEGSAGLFELAAGLVAALLFGLHPLHVESVAWVSERKDVLSAFFFILTILAYLRYAAAGSAKKGAYYGGALFFFILALLSKPMAITLPAVLLVLDFYPLERPDVKAGIKGIYRLITEKTPFFILAAIASFLTVWAQKNALIPLANVPVLLRIFIAFRAFVFYLYKMIVPLGLSPYYPYDYNPDPSVKDFLNYEYAGSLALLAVVTILCIVTAKRHKVFLAAWLYYIITLIPVSGIVQVGGQAAADRYAYLPSLGPFMLAGVGAGYLAVMHKKQARAFCFAAAAAVLIVLSALTVRQIRVWKDTLSLWSRTIEIFPDSIPVIHLSRGREYLKMGDFKRAIMDFDIAIGIYPDYGDAYTARGRAYGQSGEREKAVRDFNRAIELNPKDAASYHDRGVTYLNGGEYGKAAEDIKKSIELAPDHGMAYLNLGLAYVGLGDRELAAINFKKAHDMGAVQAEKYLNR